MSRRLVGWSATWHSQYGDGAWQTHTWAPHPDAPTSHARSLLPCPSLRNVWYTDLDIVQTWTTFVPVHLGVDRPLVLQSEENLCSGEDAGAPGRLQSTHCARCTEWDCSLDDERAPPCGSWSPIMSCPPVLCPLVPNTPLVTHRPHHRAGAPRAGVLIMQNKPIMRQVGRPETSCVEVPTWCVCAVTW